MLPMCECCQFQCWQWPMPPLPARILLRHSVPFPAKGHRVVEGGAKPRRVGTGISGFRTAARRLIRDVASGFPCGDDAAEFGISRKPDARQSLAPKLPRKPDNPKTRPAARGARKQLTRPDRKRSERRGPPGISESKAVGQFIHFKPTGRLNARSVISRLRSPPLTCYPHRHFGAPTRHHSTENYHGLTST